MRQRHLIAAGLLAACSIASTAHAHVICTAVADAATGAWIARDGDCKRRVTPASTFKLAISLMGYDSGFLKDAHAPLLPYRDGYVDWGGPAWRQPADPERWIKYSVVWYSQQVTRSLGAARFADYTRRFRYGNADVSGDAKHDGLTHAWIDSSLQISPLEQVAFLRDVVNRRLPVSPRAYEMTASITEVERTPDGWDVHGKTGSGFPALADGADDRAHGWGWFVGWASKDGKTIVFARLEQDDREQTGAPPAGVRARDAFLREWPTLIQPLAP
ncbi:class D beta-lactamase [Paraburkholderia caballeronis]|uniref:Beta-lactamase n=1 Tax=Paraburkholderia caballeronis TaxID=416943 RepID=A0A1H7S007_9BURK|nr:class D beta-lactamase [Paraburkholderia caballeronis]PXW22808.1 beta-lactamase class D/beta-lactamase class D OXA-42 [Paraburkholderia caballeronis]PXW97193.1 beta-lactamase class D/beta-lactamase class D OXA-42 [Paraburkholderia caballeronis]RAJ93713.1 beta-lactamase class D/beta-lactamase class D OXA-42 [Paraburkholderia caballeronis]SED62441.1 beta-lactamase class D/beta-lactamase class D OXA-42 [Paraburkholderia caballeronis]SEL65678.1 beta-lactamase class D/beta-lactamase class D OXA-